MYEIIMACSNGHEATSRLLRRLDMNYQGLLLSAPEDFHIITLISAFVCSEHLQDRSRCSLRCAEQLWALRLTET